MPSRSASVGPVVMSSLSLLVWRARRRLLVPGGESRLASRRRLRAGVGRWRGRWWNWMRVGCWPRGVSRSAWTRRLGRLLVQCCPGAKGSESGERRQGFRRCLAKNWLFRSAGLRSRCPRSLAGRSQGEGTCSRRWTPSRHGRGLEGMTVACGNVVGVGG